MKFIFIYTYELYLQNYFNNIRLYADITFCVCYVNVRLAKIASSVIVK